MVGMLKKRKISMILIMLILSFLTFGNTINKEKEVEKPILWVNGTYAVLTLKNGGDANIFGGFKSTKENLIPKYQIKNGLKGSWGITNKKQLNQTIATLRSGMHNPKLLEGIKITGMDKINRSQFEKELKSIEAQKDLDFLTNMYNAYEKYGDRAIMGWDLSRASQLCGWGYIAGLYTYAEARTQAIEIGKQIQKTFDSWDSFYESYLYGYEYWSKDDMNNPSSDYNKRVAIIAKLKADQKSAYNLDWNLDLSAK